VITEKVVRDSQRTGLVDCDNDCIIEGVIYHSDDSHQPLPDEIRT